MTQRTSDTHPLHITTISFPKGGALGLTFCPGKKQNFSISDPKGWNRSLEKDIDTITQWSPTHCLILIEDHEKKLLDVPTLHEDLAKKHAKIHHFPLIDDHSFSKEQQHEWFEQHQPSYLKALTEGARLLIFCKGGIGRTGLIGTLLTMEHYPMSADHAIKFIQKSGRHIHLTPPQYQTVKGYEKQKTSSQNS